MGDRAWAHSTSTHAQSSHDTRLRCAAKRNDGVSWEAAGQTRQGKWPPRAEKLEPEPARSRGALHDDLERADAAALARAPRLAHREERGERALHRVVGAGGKGLGPDLIRAGVEQRLQREPRRRRCKISGDQRRSGGGATSGACVCLQRPPPVAAPALPVHETTRAASCAVSASCLRSLAIAAEPAI